MKSGYLSRSFECVTTKGIKLKIEALRFLSMTENELGVISYRVTALDQAIEIRFEPYLDSGIKNQDSNWDDDFWKTTSVSYRNGRSYAQKVFATPRSIRLRKNRCFAIGCDPRRENRNKDINGNDNHPETRSRR